MFKYLILLLVTSSLLFSKEKVREETRYSTYTLCIAAIFQNEAPYLKEWIEYHRSVGVEHFFLYNNNSTDDYLGILASFRSNGCVTLVEWPSIQEANDWKNYSFTVQTGAYNDAIARCRHVSKWLALIDIDEFIIPVKYDDLPTLLETDFSDVSGLCVNWQCYGTSFGAECPWENGSCSILDQLVWKMATNHDWNKTSKSIVQPNHVSYCPNPHYCVYTANHWHVDTKRNACNMCCSEVNIDVLRINHYWTRDEWFLNNIKIPRYLKWGNSIEGVKIHADNMNSEFDPILANIRD
jgi:hypothetical protein